MSTTVVMKSITEEKTSTKSFLITPEQRQTNIIKTVIHPNIKLDECIAETRVSRVEINTNKLSRLSASPKTYRINGKPKMEENIIRVDHVYNGKMAVAHLGKHNKGISLKLPSPLNSPTIIVNKRPPGKLPTFLPPYINMNGRIQNCNGPEITTSTNLLSVLNTTQKPNITSTQLKDLATSANPLRGVKVNEESKENKLISKNTLNTGKSYSILNPSFSVSGASKTSKEVLYSSPFITMQTKVNGLKAESDSKKEITEIISRNSNENIHQTADEKALKNNEHQDKHNNNNGTHDTESNGSIRRNGIEEKEENSTDNSQPIVCNICDGENTKFIGHAAFKLHYNKYHCLRRCEICHSECFGTVGLHTHMIDYHVEKKPKTNNTTLSGKMTKISPNDSNKTFNNTSNMKIKVTSSQNTVPLQRTMKDIRYHQEVIPKNCNPKRYKTLHRCQECKYMTYHGQNLNRHIDSFHHKRSCSYCGVVCTGKKPLTDHLRLVHQVKVSPDKFSERGSSTGVLDRYHDTPKKITTALLKRSKKWDKVHCHEDVKNKTSWSNKMKKHNKIDYHKLSAKHRLLKNIRKELHLSKDKRGKPELKKLLSFPLGVKDEKYRKEKLSGKCPYCDMVLSGRDLLCQHVESEHGIALKFLSQHHNSSEEEEDDDGDVDASIERDLHSKSHYNTQKYNKINGTKKKRYSSESSHNGSTDDYDEDDAKTLHLETYNNTITSLYDNFYVDAEYDSFHTEEKGFVPNEVSTGDAVSMEHLMQKALSNVMSFSSPSENTTTFCFSDSENAMVSIDEDANPNEAFINGPPTCFAKCLPTNEDLAAWELFREF